MIITDLQELRHLLPTGKPIVALDYGQKKLGFAISHQDYTIAMPIKTINCADDLDKIKLILAIINDYSACALIVGLPIMMNGTNSDQTRVVQNFVNNLSTKTNIPIYMQDERLTSQAANNLLKSFGLKRKQRNQIDDCVAASLILETALSIIKLYS